ncbi:hypothetical protein B7G68_08810 [Caulobacter segnis]|uniref:Endonuclease/exonuclease/phosphatase domain-containing protein n=1 Tax=Caulobacter segnis TaxID=88688 RepID=A0ABM6TFL4_9CAUL|nr:exodeoxyribonuclease III [Caulobacter segnis]AVQ01938.1 hypothetical protein B7G68_08810 [Caulobacter segnis]
MRIATLNINNVLSRFDPLIEWLDDTQPDVVCLQELKAQQGRFPAEALGQMGYGAVWKGQRAWNGVAILARGMTPVLTRSALPGEPDRSQSRYIEAAVDGVLIGCLYLPNGNPAPGPKFDYKLAWFEALLAHTQSLLNTGAPVVLAGDDNVVPTEADIYPNHSYWPPLWRSPCRPPAPASPPHLAATPRASSSNARPPLPRPSRPSARTPRASSPSAARRAPSRFSTDQRAWACPAQAP